MFGSSGHVFPFLRSSLCFVIGSSSCVLSACSHVFHFMYVVCFRGQLPSSFVMFHDYFVLRPLSHVLFCTCLFVHICLSSLFTCTQYAFISLIYSSHFSFHKVVLTSSPRVKIKETIAKNQLHDVSVVRVFRLTA